MSLEFTTTEITHLAVDAIVIPCSPHAVITEGMNDAIYHAGNPSLFTARQKIGALPFGRAALTPAFDLPAKSAIHVAIPPYQSHNLDALQRAYTAIFHLAKTNHITTLALPLLGYLTQGYPYPVALTVLLQSLMQSSDVDDLRIKLIYPPSHRPIDWQSLRTYIATLLIENNTVSTATYSNALYESKTPAAYRLQSRIHQELTEQLAKCESGFSSKLLSLISESGQTDPVIYKKANIDRKLFSKIRNNPDYQPTKSTALAFAIALELDITTTNDLLRTAGYTLTHTSRRDIIVEYFILQKTYDIFCINEALFCFGEPSLGSN